MAELGAGSGTGYPGALDTDTTQETNGSTYIRADVPNDLAAAIVAIETELGTDPAGSLTNVKTYLQTEHAADGTHTTDTISEKTAAAGVTVDGVLLKDSEVTTDTINEKTGAAGVTIDGFGIKDNAPNPTSWPAFKADRNGVNQTVSSTDPTKIKFTNEVYDTNSDFEHDADDSGGATESRFTPTVAGKYIVVIHAFLQSCDTGYFTAAIYKNGTVSQIVYDYTAIATRSLIVVDIISMNGSTDYIEAWVTSGTDTSYTVGGAIANTIFAASRIA